jgi:hypothetical protein
MTQIGDTSIDLKNLVTGNKEAGHLIAVAGDGALVDSGIAASEIGALEVATSTDLGGVKSGTTTPEDEVVRASMFSSNGELIEKNKIIVDNRGFMTLNRVSTTLLYVPTGDSLILDGGTSNGGVVSG